MEADDFHRLTKVLADSGESPTLEAAASSFASYGVSIVLGARVADSIVDQVIALTAINAAARSIDLSAAYFVPDEISRDAIVAALRRGVRVRIITPGPHTDAETVRRASRALWGDLLAAGAEIYEYQPTMYHVKVLIADEYLVSVGSTNFDDRSFRLNDEASLNIFDEKFARRQVQIFERDLGQSARVTLEQWRSRPLAEKAWEHVAAALGPQL